MDEQVLILRLGEKITGLQAEYEVVSHPESGAYAQVYEVADTSTGHPAILKLNAISNEEPTILARVSNILAGAGKPERVVNVIDRLLKPVNGLSGHVEEKAPGVPLKKLDQLDETTAISLAIEFAEILALCADNNIAYLDVKPLEHLFYDSESTRIAIIDWNVARLEPSLPELRDDLLNFCKRLPEFFTRQPQDDPRTALHPLGWSLRRQTDYLGRSLSYAVWQLLANLSLSSVGPVLPQLYDLLRIPSRLEMRNMSPASKRGLVHDAWQAVIGELKRVAGLLAGHPSGLADLIEEVNPAVTEAKADLNTLMQRSLRQTKLASVEGTEKEWQIQVKNAQASAEHLRQSLLQTHHNLRAGARREVEQPLLLARHLHPEEESLALAGAVYWLWDRLGTLGDETKMVWRSLLIALLKQDVGSVRNALESNDTELVQLIHDRLDEWFQGSKGEPQDDPRSLSNVWRFYFDEFRNRAVAWSWIYEAQNHTFTGVEARLELLDKAAEKAPAHPVVRMLREQTQQEQKQHQRIKTAQKQMLEALRRCQPEDARQALSQLENDANINPYAQRLVTRFAGRVEVLEKQEQVKATVQKAVDSWERSELEAALPLLIDLKGAGVDLLVKQFEQQLRLVKDIEAGIQRVQGLLQDVHIENTDIQSNARTLYVIENDLLQLSGKGPLSQEMKALWMQWASNLSTLWSVIKKESGKMLHSRGTTRELDADLTKISELLVSIEQIKQLKPPSRYVDRLDSIGDEISEYHSQLLQIQDDTRKQYNEIERKLEKLLAQGHSLEAQVQLKDVPQSLIEKYKAQTTEIQFTAKLLEIESALELNNLDDAKSLIREGNELALSIDGGNTRLAPLERKLSYLSQLSELRKQVENLLAHPSEVEWMARADALQAHLDSIQSLGAEYNKNDEIEAWRDKLQAKKSLFESGKQIQSTLSQLYTLATITARRINQLENDLFGEDSVKTPTTQASVKRNSAYIDTSQPEQSTDLVNRRLPVERIRNLWRRFLPGQKDILDRRPLIEQIQGLGKRSTVLSTISIVLSLLTLASLVLLMIGAGSNNSLRLVSALPSATAALLAQTESSSQISNSELDATPEMGVLTSIPSPTQTQAPTAISATVTPMPTHVSEDITSSPITWKPGTQYVVIMPRVTAYQSLTATLAFWQFDFSQAITVGLPITPTVVFRSGPVETFFIEVEALFKVYAADILSEPGISPNLIPAGTMLYSANGTNEVNDVPVGILSVNWPLSEHEIIESAGDNSWYIVRLIGWLPVESVKPSIP